MNVFHTLWITVVWWTAFTFQYWVFSLPSCPFSVYNHTNPFDSWHEEGLERQVGMGENKQVTLPRLLWLQSWFSLENHSFPALSSSTLLVRNFNLIFLLYLLGLLYHCTDALIGDLIYYMWTFSVENLAHVKKILWDTMSHKNDGEKTGWGI